MKRIILRGAALLSLLSVLLLTTGCGTVKKYTFTDMTVFDTEAIVTGYDVSEAEFQKKAEGVFSLLKEYHRLYDIYNEYEGINNLCTVNLNRGKAPVKVDERIIDLLEFAKEMYRETDGLMNIAMGSVTSLWHDFRESDGALPTEQALEAAGAHTDISCIVIDRERGTVFLSDGEMSLDVGACAKGYATECAARFIEEQGWDNIALSIGGNVRTVGEKAGGEGWTVGIQNPYDGDGEKVKLSRTVTDASCVTSGSYQRYRELDGVRYHHIIDGETLYPENRYLSVTVLCRDSGVADALSTALFNAGEETGKKILSRFDAEGIWIYSDGKVSQG